MRMKAKELYQQDLDRSSTMSENENLSVVANHLIREITELIESRGCKQDAAAFSVVDEVIQKWRAFARLAGMNEDGFAGALDHWIPEVMVAYRRNRKIARPCCITQKGG